MAAYDILALAEPLSEDGPCGPDLEELGDPDFWQFSANIETEVPSNFDGFFEARRTNVDFEEKLKACYELLERSRDIRLTVWLAKLCLLTRDLSGFVDSLVVTDRLLREHWDHVHPLPFEGDQTMRMVNIERLDERPSVELPLQYVKLIEDQSGTVAFRDHLVGIGEVQPREGERFRSVDDLNKTFLRCDVEKIAEARETLETLRTAVAGLHSNWLEKAGYEQHVQLERLPALLDRMYAYVHEKLVERRPELAEDTTSAEESAPEEEGEGETTAAAVATAPAPQGTIKRSQDVLAALGAVSGYFEAHEPSSPARLLVKQAEVLVGKSWVDVVRTLLPDYFDTATIRVDGTSPFDLPLSALSERTGIGYDDGYGESAAEEEGEGDGEDAPVFTVGQRSEAAKVLADVVAYYKRVEPSSPLPALLDRAQALLSRDFTTIIKDILPAEE